LVAIGVSLTIGCEARVSLGGRCTSNAECSAPLACVGARCREAGAAAQAGAFGLRCVAGPSGSRACTLSIEESCGGGAPCESALFATCREGRCVTGCANGDECVSGVCDTTSGAGVCVEPLSTGGADAGPIDAAIPSDAPSGCAPAATGSARSLGEAVLGVTGATEDETTRWVDRGAPLTLTGTLATRLSVGIRAGGMRADESAAPRVVTVVSLGPRDLSLDQLSAFHFSIFDTLATPVPSRNLSSGYDFGLTVTSGLDDDLRYVALRPTPSDDAPTFAWIVSDRDGAAAVNLNSSPPYPTVVGGAALFDGPDVDGVRTLFALYYVEADGTPRLGVIGEDLGRGNSTDRVLPAGFGAGPIALSAVAGGMLLFDPDGGDALLARCTGAMGPAPTISLQPIALETDLAPALVRGIGAASYHAITSTEACDSLPIAAIQCGADTCTLEAPRVAVPAPRALAFEATSWGSATAILVRTGEGARLVVLDDALQIVSDRVVLAANETYEGVDPFTLREAHLASSVSGGVGALAVAGLYADAGGAVRVEVHAVRVSAP
ncbi:MAG: hypothetical protein K1X94_17040, partial [Sandaracinaceae bacterium]|nr:hypothetical protein [Sandaracinaceae bacterium]